GPHASSRFTAQTGRWAWRSANWMTRSERTQLISRELSPNERPRRAAEAAWRIEWPRLVAGLTRMLGDIDAAEDLAQDALLAAVEQWPRDGVPPNPGAWLMLTAKHRAIDRRRRDATFRRKLSVLGGELVIEDAEQPLPASVDPDFAIEDNLLRMVFTACHPVLLPPARVALTLRLVGAGHWGDRASLPGTGVDGGATDRAGQTEARRRTDPLRGVRRR